MSILPDERRLTETAAGWLVDLDGDFRQDQRRFAAWMSESARHIEEFLFVSAVRAELSALLRRQSVDVQALVEAARADSPNVVPLRADDDAPHPDSPRRLSRGWLAAACMTALLGVLAWGAVAWSQFGTLSTDLGEQRTLGLADGTVVHLNTLSALRVNFSDAAREIRLLRGEALFRVAPDPARPFRVRAGDAVIQATGTQFNVYRREREITVSVIEGSVRISRNESAPASDAGALVAGEQAQLAPDSMRTSRVDTSQVGAWRLRRLVFVNERLADVAREFNRYNQSPHIEVAEGAAGSTLMSGVFDADDPQSLLLFVEDLPHLLVEREPDQVFIRSRQHE